MTSLSGRPLDLAGRYFAVLDQLWPANVVCVAELDTVFSAHEVDSAWQQLCSASPIARARVADIAGRPLLVDEPGVGGDFQFRSGPLESVLAEEQRVRFDLEAGPLVRCRYVVAEGGSALLVTGHHAVLDARGGYVLLQRLAGVLAGSEPPQPLPLPPGIEERIRPGRRWPQDRSAALGLLREMSEQRRAAGPVDELLGPAGDAGQRRLQVSLHRLDQAQTAALFARAKAVGATGYGIIAAAWLHATHDLFSDGRPTHHLSLTTPADLRTRLDPPVPADVPGMFASLISTSHVVGEAGLDAVADEVSTTVQAAVDRGEGELFYAVARPGALDERGAARLRSTLAATPQSVAVSNTGRLAEGDDPEWVRSVWFSFAPTPNQLVFVSATTYRGRLTMALCADRARVPIDLPDRLAAGALRRLLGG
jgi:hypothetical protein